MRPRRRCWHTSRRSRPRDKATATQRPSARDPAAVRNGGVSFWYSDNGTPDRRPGLQGDLQVDVCIVGAGFTGLWTAYYLATHQPDCRIAVLEREFAGYGASGRNGGQMSGDTWVRSRYLTQSSDDRLLAMEMALRATPAEIRRVAASEGIDADFHHGGNLSVATTPAQRRRQEKTFQALIRRYGSHAGIELLSRDEVLERVRVADALGAVRQSFPWRIQPAKLVRGLSDAVERKGVAIYEDTEVAEIAPRRVLTSAGARVTADIVVRATEGFTPQLPGAHRDLIPLNSAIVVTEPVPSDVMAEIGWEGRETVNETSYLYNYCQRTRGDRIAVGGRGVPYRFWSGVDRDGGTQLETISNLLSDLDRLFPQLAGVRVDQAWCGSLGVARDWCARVNFDRASGLAWAGGYFGDGISPSNLAGRTLADLILGRDTELTTFPWVNFPVQRWEPEPLRWLGIHAMYQLYALADRHERGGSASSSWLAAIANGITGKGERR
jgi:glycine/D-amino acid oxidase-like deaminating enzyme